MSIIPPGHEITISTNKDGRRDVVLVFVGDGSDPHTVEILLQDIDSPPYKQPLDLKATLLYLLRKSND